MDLKSHLKQLIVKSPALNSLSDAERKVRTDIMLNADEATMKEFIAVLENEAVQMTKIDEEFKKDASEIESLLAEAKQLENEANREIRKDSEQEERADDDKKAEEMLAQLDKIAGK